MGSNLFYYVILVLIIQKITGVKLAVSVQWISCEKKRFNLDKSSKVFEVMLLRFKIKLWTF